MVGGISVLIVVLATGWVIMPGKFKVLSSFFNLVHTRNEGNRMVLFRSMIYQLLTGESGQMIIFRESFNLQKFYITLFF